MRNATERMDVIAAYRDVGAYQGAAGAALCDTTHKTERRTIEAHEAASAGRAPPRQEPESKGIVEDLVGYAKYDLLGPARA